MRKSYKCRGRLGIGVTSYMAKSVRDAMTAVRRLHGLGFDEACYKSNWIRIDRSRYTGEELVDVEMVISQFRGRPARMRREAR